MNRHIVGAALAATLLLGCDPLGLAPDDDDYNFDTTCRDNSDLNQCSDCCRAIGGDTAAVRTGNCGCATVVQSTTVCDSSTNFDMCESCCNGNGYDGVVSFSGGTGGDTCTCSRLEPTSSTGPADAGPRDGCATSGQPCTCSNTGLSGMCGTGPDAPGLYCRCD